MATCPSGHDSASQDFCDVCGVLIGAAPSLAAEGPAPLAAPASGTAGPAGGIAGPPPAPAEPCPRCGSPRTGQFCESCGYDFTAAVPGPPLPPAPAPSPAPLPPAPLPPAPLPPAPPSPARLPPAPPVSPVSPPSSATLPGPPAPLPVPPAPVLPRTVPPAPAFPGQVPAGTAAPAAAGTGWTAVVTADRGYFDSVQAASGLDADGITFPVYCPQRRFPLTGTEMRIGRRSTRSGIDPEIDLTGPPADPGVSRLHAVLLRAPDGTWSVIDPGSANGTLVNGSEIPRDHVVPVHPGDRIHVGAWTAISILRED